MTKELDGKSCIDRLVYIMRRDAKLISGSRLTIDRLEKENFELKKQVRAQAAEIATHIRLAKDREKSKLRSA